MVSRHRVFLLMNLARGLTHIQERCRSVIELQPPQSVDVRAEILSSLDNQQTIAGMLGVENQLLIPEKNAMSSWFDYLENKYPERPVRASQGFLDADDAKRLSEECVRWLDTARTLYRTEGTVLIKEEKLEEVLPASLFAKLSEPAQMDLRDGVDAILNLLPMPASLMLLRLGENIARSYYAVVTKKKTEGMQLPDIVKELEQNERVGRSMIGHLRYIRDRTKDIQFAHMRFDQEGSEQILMHVKGLLEGI